MEKTSPKAPPVISQKAHLERFMESTFLPETSGKMHNADPRAPGTKTSQIPIRTRVDWTPVSSLVPVRWSVWTKRAPMDRGISMIAARLISGIPGESGFSINTSSPLMVANTLADRAITGIRERARRKEPAMTSFLVGSNVACSIPRKSAVIPPWKNPAVLIVRIVPNIVTAASDLDQRGFPLPLEAA